MKGPVAIVGAGLSGLSCAQAMRAAGIEARVFEESPRVGGRCATRLWQGHLVDYGVQYFTAQTPDFKKELLTRLRQFRPIIPPVFDQDGNIVASPGGPRFYVLQGNNYFPQVLARSLDVRLNVAVGPVKFGSGGIECAGETYPAVVSSLPGPQTACLFGLKQSPADYISCLTALLEYAGTDIEEAHECYARLLPEDREPLMASYCENHKSGRIIGNRTVFVVQAGPKFSESHFDEPPENYIPQLVKTHEEIWKIPTGKCTATFGQRWRLCRPQEGHRHRVTLPPGAFLCGDSRSESSVEEVWLDGLKAAQEVIDFLAR